MIGVERNEDAHDSLPSNTWEHLDQLELTANRKIIVDSLKERGWFKDTSPELQATLASLPQTGRENHDGFLTDLTARPDEIGGVAVERLVDLPRGNFALVPKFEVRNIASGQTYTYEYVSWRYGPESGAKGIVLVDRGDGDISDFILLRGDKFATGAKEWDTIGGFIDLNVDGVTTVMQRAEKEIKEELGVPDLKIKSVHNLGRYSPDAGMTNNRPEVFAAIVDASEATRIDREPLNPDVYELRSGAIIFPIKQLPELIRANDDGFFHIAVNRALAAGILPPEYVVGNGKN